MFLIPLQKLVTKVQSSSCHSETCALLMDFTIFYIQSSSEKKQPTKPISCPHPVAAQTSQPRKILFGTPKSQCKKNRPASFCTAIDPNQENQPTKEENPNLALHEGTQIRHIPSGRGQMSTGWCGVMAFLSTAMQSSCQSSVMNSHKSLLSVLLLLQDPKQSHRLKPTHLWEENSMVCCSHSPFRERNMDFTATVKEEHENNASCAGSFLLFLPTELLLSTILFWFIKHWIQSCFRATGEEMPQKFLCWEWIFKHRKAGSASASLPPTSNEMKAFCTNQLWLFHSPNFESIQKCKVKNTAKPEGKHFLVQTWPGRERGCPSCHHPAGRAAAQRSRWRGRGPFTSNHTKLLL